MKQWVAILALLWVTATMQTAGEHRAHSCPTEICAAVMITEPGGETRLMDEAPLLATSTLPAPSHLCGASHDAGKGGRHTETNGTIAALAPHASLHGHQLDASSTSSISDPVSTHTAGRYIYFLRRIII